MALRVALLGGGFMGRMHAAAYSYLDDVELVALACKEPRASEEYEVFRGLRVYDDGEQMMEQERLDLVDICLPTFLHAEWAIKAAKRGLHVLSEKPMALKVEDADRIIETVEQAGVKFMVAHCIRFWKEYLYLRDVVESGELGVLKSIKMWRAGAAPLWSWDGWLLDKDRSGSMMIDMMIHDVDFLQVIAGKPLEVHALGFRKDALWIHANVLLRFRNELSAFLEGSWALPESRSFKFGFLAVFENGVVEYDVTGDPALTVYQGKEVTHPVMDVPELPKTDLGGNVTLMPCYLDEISYFLECIREDREPDRVPAKESRDALAIALAMVDSAQTGKTLDIPVD